MGCCVSTPKNNPLENTNNNNNKNNINPHQFQCVSKSPPRAEEEAVKEVLSETPKPRPKPKPKPRSRPESPRKRQVDEVREDDDVDEEDESMMKPKVMVVTPNKEYLEQKTGNPYPDPSTPEEISEVSEICSYSETISTSTLKEEDDLHSNHQHHLHHQVYSSKDNTNETRQQRMFRSQGYNGNFQTLHYHHPQQQQQQQQHYRSQGKSPARRRPDPESSPARKRPPPGQTGPRREVGGDNLGRRSQSPAMRGNVGRSPSGRKTGPSPGRVRMVNGPEGGKKVEEEEEEEVGEGRRESEEWQGPNESLENPLVSLECFIFL